jgi:hypothetical protein
MTLSAILGALAGLVLGWRLRGMYDRTGDDPADRAGA